MQNAALKSQRRLITSAKSWANLSSTSIVFKITLLQACTVELGVVGIELSPAATSEMKASTLASASSASSASSARPIPGRNVQIGQDPLPRGSIAGADDTDGTDGAFGTPVHSNRSRPCPAFAGERDLDAQGPEKRLRPPQSPGERSRIFCP